MPPDASGRIYSATYSNVPVYKFNVEGNHVMRRRADDWINATHILEVADFDKLARTRILEREVQNGVHEKVQGGYGKYQG
ncbi:transcription regulator HTH, apses-type DNA-binding domain-containing protein [Macrophomina phaseolina]|uniref:Transcription regulator HTH, apses-type DNA-binding domain-containing protein n=1 Tax=Macrophomina phaseolina TaxID=35725 RepID=A0ABQ8FUL8_9PEZI|nr:transcription regulator HTH, apses-type DNA-binding domain-containing protein [Macrophomina phaseolina]